MVDAVLGTERAAPLQAEEVHFGLQKLAAVDAAEKLRLVTDEPQQMQLVVTCAERRVGVPIQAIQRLGQEIEEQRLRIVSPG